MNSFLKNRIIFLCMKTACSGISCNNKLLLTQSLHSYSNLSIITSFQCREKCLFPLFVSKRQMAGHSKWQNIKNIKAEKDKQKSLSANKFSFLIRLAVREGGPEPKNNHKLAVLIENAKKENIPNSLVENALKAGNNKKTKFGSMEILTPGGCLVLLEYETDNISTTRHELKSICKKYGSNILAGEGGRWRAVYEQKGIIKVVGCKDAQSLNAERALDAAIEAGAEEVQTKQDEMDKTVLEFLCAAGDLHSVKKELEREYEVEESYVGYIPTVTIQLEKDSMELVDNLLEELGNHNDVVRIFENAQ